MPTTAVCPLCGDERVEVGQNKNDRPKFTCSTFKTTVNLRGPKDRREEFLRKKVALAESDGADPDGDTSHMGANEESDGEDEPASLEDLLGGESNE